MAVNRFDQPAEAQFMNTYVPIPFEAMMKAGQAKQQRYDQTAAAMDQSVVAADQLRAIPNSMDEQHIQQVRRTMYNIRDKYATKDLSDPMVRRQLNNEINSSINKDHINRIQQSYAGWENYMKQKASMEAKGQRVFDDVNFTNYDSSQGNIFTGLPTMDLGAQAEQAINAFMTKPEQKYREVTLPSGRLGVEHYRDVNEIRSLIDTESGELMNNPAIRQLMQRKELDEAGFKQFLSDRAPSYVDKKLSSTYAPATVSGGTQSYEQRLSDLLGLTGGGEEKQSGDLNIREIGKKIDELKLSKDPVDQTKAEIMESAMQEHIDYVDEQHSKEEEDLYKDVVRQMIDSGEYASGEEAMDAIRHTMSNPGRLKRAMLAEGVEWTANGIRKVVNSAARVMIRSAGLPITAKGTILSLEQEDIDKALNDGDFSNISSKFREVSDAIIPLRPMDEVTEEKEIDISGVGNLMIDLKVGLDKLDKVKKGEVAELAENDIRLNPIMQSHQTLDVPIKFSQGVGYLVDRATGKQLGVSDFYHTTLKRVKNRPGDFLIKQYRDAKGKEVKDKKVNLNDYEIRGTSVNTTLRRENKYKPFVTVDLYNDETKESLQMDVVITEPTQVNALISDLIAGHDYGTAIRLSNSRVEEAIDLLGKEDSTTIEMGKGILPVVLTPGPTSGTYNVRVGNKTSLRDKEGAKELVYDYTELLAASRE